MPPFSATHASPRFTYMMPGGARERKGFIFYATLRRSPAHLLRASRKFRRLRRTPASSAISLLFTALSATRRHFHEARLLSKAPPGGYTAITGRRLYIDSFPRRAVGYLVEAGARPSLAVHLCDGDADDASRAARLSASLASLCWPIPWR